MPTKYVQVTRNVGPIDRGGDEQATTTGTVTYTEMIIQIDIASQNPTSEGDNNNNNNSNNSEIGAIM